MLFSGDMREVNVAGLILQLQHFADFETVDTLDERHNHNLRNVLKDFSDWPTIPQVYYRGSLLGGHDIIEDLYKSGQLKHILVPGSTAEAA